MQPVWTRRSHRKSRLGCLTCKHRRVKCDERKPICSVCEQKAAVCIYATDNKAVSQRPAQNLCRPHKLTKHIPANLLRTLDATDLEVAMIQNRLTGKPEPSTSQSSAQIIFGAEDLRYLRHFQRHTGFTLGDLAIQEVYTTEVPQIALESPCLMSAVLAFSSLHQSYLRHEAGLSVESSRYVRVRFQECLSQYIAAIQLGITRRNKNVMLVTSTLVTGLAAALVDSSTPTSCWPFTDDPHALFWLRVQPGISLMMKATLPLDEGSKLALVFWEEPPPALPRPSNKDIIEAAPELCQLCEFNENSTSSNNIYHNAIHIIIPLMAVECTPETLFDHLGFLDSVNDTLYNLLEAKDHRALLLLAYWYTKVCNIDFWWISGRAKLECAAICLYLEKFADTAVRSLLKTPARACGVRLSRKADDELMEVGEYQPMLSLPCKVM